MDGSYQNKIKQNISKWIHSTSIDAKWDEFPNVHLDELIETPNDKFNSINLAIYAYEYFLTQIDLNKYNGILAISLNYSDNSSEYLPDTLEDLQHDIYITPPSLYMLPSDYNDFEETIKNCKKVNHYNELKKYNVYYKIEKEDDEFLRTIYVYKKIV